MAKKKKEISKNHINFINEYLSNGFNAAAAYLKTYPRARKEIARITANTLLKREDVKEYIEKRQKENEIKMGIDSDRLLNILVSWLESDITEMIDLSATEVKELPIEARRLVTSFKRYVTTRKEKDGTEVVSERFTLTFVSKEKAAEMIARHIGFNEKDNDQRKDLINNIINLGRGIKPETN